ncbi:helix-turn-helix domain-containing protein [Arthrobacter sp. 18067]|uniref:helix-turn-helix domain-containing protein n=1 Tax=Arthrobacter sp. 18067 TaxID=2681413 RepID=UPI0034DD45B0
MSTTEAGLITTAQASEASGRSWRSIIRLVEKGDLKPAQKLPGLRGAYLFKPSDIEALSDGSPKRQRSQLSL